MTKKKLIVGGDSWTDPNFKSNIDLTHIKDYNSWPEILNELFGNKYDIVNTACSGYGNDYIISQTIKAVSENVDEVGLVVLTLSEYSRFNVGNHRKCFPYELFKIISKLNSGESIESINSNELSQYVYEMFSSTNDNEQAVSIAVTSLLSRIITFQTYCEKYSIPYIIVPFLDQFEIIIRRFLSTSAKLKNVWTPKNIAKHMTNNDLFYMIDDEKIIGWPFVDTLGGFVIDEILTEDLRIGNGDFHPGKSGHKKIAEMIYEFCKEKEINCYR